jgi:hypothetical protein
MRSDLGIFALSSSKGVEFAHEQEDASCLAILRVELERLVKNFLRTWARHPARIIPEAPIFL